MWTLVGISHLHSCSSGILSHLSEQTSPTTFLSDKPPPRLYQAPWNSLLWLFLLWMCNLFFSSVLPQIAVFSQCFIWGSVRFAFSVAAVGWEVTQIPSGRSLVGNEDGQTTEDMPEYISEAEAYLLKSRLCPSRFMRLQRASQLALITIIGFKSLVSQDMKNLHEAACSLLLCLASLWPKSCRAAQCSSKLL